MPNCEVIDQANNLASKSAALLILDERGMICDLTDAARVIFADSAEQLLGTAFDQHPYGRVVADLHPGRWWPAMIGERPYHLLVTDQSSEESACIVICIASPLEGWSFEELLRAFLSETLAPLTSIKGFTELLRREIGDPITPRQQEFLDAIAKHTDQLLALRNDVFIHARHIQDGRPER